MMELRVSCLRKLRALLPVPPQPQLFSHDREVSGRYGCPGRNKSGNQTTLRPSSSRVSPSKTTQSIITTLN
jgi:hypothetical protein